MKEEKAGGLAALFSIEKTLYMYRSFNVEASKHYFDNAVLRPEIP